MERKFDLEERLITYAVSVIKVIDTLPSNKATTHLGGQLIRSSTSPALNYGEVQAAESRKDFIHKMKIVLKELRENFNASWFFEK
jgi:four helix bundle protein